MAFRVHRFILGVGWQTMGLNFMSRGSMKTFPVFEK
jgi:hypothetical protein